MRCFLLIFVPPVADMDFMTSLSKIFFQGSRFNKRCEYLVNEEQKFDNLSRRVGLELVCAFSVLKQKK